ncbi:hypothetical protein CN378_04385 [Bacillus sp. AFS015802]|uniref:hypothetical protein n=1 Tax=Bacillus sp. AFS015802 TaxID=2033486 RepID=UPI000BF815D4|nr:hypothetical protein [Bacillus sp. AFS015802]PFA69123.1 hypothetical protein CN378_04385 [Bacillus sp. AFS015802]
MKKAKLKTLFDHIDEQEKSTVEFQTVWRKAHRRDWKRRVYQSAVPNMAFLMILLIITPLAGYYFISPGEDTRSAQSLEDHEESYEMSGKVYNFPNQVVIKGETSLPEGAMLMIEQYKRDGVTLIRREKVTTDSDGYFQFATDRLQRDKEYIVKVMLYPHLQRESIKKVVGKRGDKLSDVENGELVFDYRHDGIEYSGLKLVGLANKMEDTTEKVVSEFLMSEKEFEALY